MSEGREQALEMIDLLIEEVGRLQVTPPGGDLHLEQSRPARRVSQP